MKINISGVSKPAVLAALYNSSKPLGMGIFHYDPTPMSEQDAQEIIEGRGDDATAMFGNVRGDSQIYFDYLKGRVMKVDLSGNDFDTWGYDRDNGEGAAEKALKAAGLI